MKVDVLRANLPANYFEGKDGTTYRFTILKDIAAAGSAVPVPYNDSLQGEIIGLYSKYRDFALYVHSPWCIEHCSYCHYYRNPMSKISQLERMMEAEKKHALMMDQWIDLPHRNIHSIYFGGGTPTVLPADLLEEILAYYVDRYGSHNDYCEVCLEASPITLKPKKIDILERYINRLSIGIQSFDDRILKIIERKHTSALAKEVLAEVVPRFASVNIDLIYGLYQQGLSDWLATVETAINLKVQSLTIYRLDIREVEDIIRTFRQEPEMFPDELMCWRMYNEARQMLEQTGYRENLVGWFLLPQVKDTTVYRERWEKQSPCIALGPQLHTYGADHFYETIYNHEKYIEAVEAGKLPIQHIYEMTPQKQLIWYVLAQLKSNSPVYKPVIIQRFGENLLKWFMGLIRNYITWGVVEESEEKVELTPNYHYILEWMLIELIGHLGTASNASGGQKPF
jgi:oxygen-independent coproporphyrinogen-3 oxidase